MTQTEKFIARVKQAVAIDRGLVSFQCVIVNGEPVLWNIKEPDAVEGYRAAFGPEAEASPIVNAA